MCKNFIENYETLVNKHAPLKPISKHNQNLKQKPWMNASIRNMIKRKNKLFKQYIKDKSEETYKQYKQIRNEVTRCIQQQKKNYYEQLFSSISSDSRKIWRNINKLMKYKEPRRNSICELKNKDGQVVKDSQTIANIMNDFFVTIGEDLANKIPAAADTSMDELISSAKNTIFLSPVTPQEINNIIQQMDINKSTPSYSAPIWFLKISAPYCCNEIAELFNRFFNEGIFPDVFKTAEIIPVFKSGDPKIASNHRPIAMLSPLSKVLEKCIYSRLEKYIYSNNFLYEQQFGFRKKSSTENAAVQIHHQIMQDLDKKHTVCSLFLDLRKAFDTVHHETLLKKLHNYGIRGNAFNLIRTYLTNRKQYTIINGKKSAVQSVKFGVPQGSILGPLLFIIYINDLRLSTTFKVNLFADDGYLSLSNSSEKELEQEVNFQLNKVNCWLQYNKLSLHPDKTTYLIFSRKKTKYSFDIKIGQVTLKESSETKYLGLLIDNKLSWKPHIKKIKSKLSSTCWALSRIRPYVNDNVLRNIYFGLIYPHLQYCIVCWGGSTQAKELFILQKRAIRTIDRKPVTTPSSPIFNKLNLLKLEDIYKLKLGTMMLKIKNKSWQGALNYKEIQSIHSHKTRLSTSNNFYIPYVSTKTARFSSYFMGPTFWSTIPNDIKALPQHLFKSNYTKHLINLY